MIEAIKFVVISASATMRTLKVIQQVFHLVFLASCSSYTPVSELVKEPYTINNSYNENATAEALIRPYREPMQASMAETLCYSSAPAVKGLPESTLGNLITDVLRSEIAHEGQKADFCFLNTGGLRMEWPQGAITRNHVFELMPFENDLVMVRMNRNQIDTLLSGVASKGGAPLSGIRLQLSGNTVQKWMVPAKPDAEAYWLLTSDYLVNGGDKYKIRYESLIRLNLKVRDGIQKALVQINKRGETLNPTLDGRTTVQ